MSIESAISWGFVGAGFLLLAAFVRQYLPQAGNQLKDEAYEAEVRELLDTCAALLKKPIPPRPPTFCTGCPERPVFAALKLAQEETGPVHYSVDIGCHA